MVSRDFHIGRGCISVASGLAHDRLQRSALGLHPNKAIALEHLLRGVPGEGMEDAG